MQILRNIAYLDVRHASMILACSLHVDGLEVELAGLGLELRMAGDCLTPRTAEEAVLEGMKAGCAV